MKKTHTLIAPQMSPIHFRLLEQLFRDVGYKFQIVPHVTTDAISCGLRCVNNDMCCPTIITVGQVVDETLRLNLEHPDQKYAIVMTQTGGGCRASNYVGAIRLALIKKGRTDIPVVPLAFTPGGDEPWNQLGLKIRDLKSAVYAILLGDLLMTWLYKTRPYEICPGDSDRLVKELSTRVCEAGLKRMNDHYFSVMIDIINYRFEQIRVNSNQKPKIGIVGEILLKYHPDANNHLVDVIEKEGCEAVVTPLIDFFLYCLSGPVFQHKLLSRAWWKAALAKKLIAFIEKRKQFISESSGFYWPSIYKLSQKVEATDEFEEIISLTNSMGEGWLLPAEMVDLVEQGCPHIIIAQPLACLPNHSIGQGTIAPITERYPEARIISINYDPNTSETNQLNRIKLFAEDAKEYQESKKQSPNKTPDYLE